jgi:hypothetical protein
MQHGPPMQSQPRQLQLAQDNEHSTSRTIPTSCNPNQSSLQLPLMLLCVMC